MLHIEEIFRRKLWMCWNDETSVVLWLLLVTSTAQWCGGRCEGRGSAWGGAGRGSRGTWPGRWWGTRGRQTSAACSRPPPSRRGTAGWRSCWWRPGRRRFCTPAGGRRRGLRLLTRLRCVGWKCWARQLLPHHSRNPASCLLSSESFDVSSVRRGGCRTCHSPGWCSSRACPWCGHACASSCRSSWRTFCHSPEPRTRKVSRLSIKKR